MRLFEAGNKGALRAAGLPLRPRPSGLKLAIVALAATAGAVADVRVQDIGWLQGRRTNKLVGYGLVVGLDGTGDGGKNQHTMRALMAIHRKFHQPVLSSEELKSVDNVALVAVEATIPEFGAREGQTLDVVVSAFAAKSLKGGQLLTTPLQFALFDENDPRTQQILAFAGGRVDLPDPTNPKRGLIRGGCTLEADFFYNFILDGCITLVLDDEHAGFQWAQLVARAVNHELRNSAQGSSTGRDRPGVAQASRLGSQGRIVVPSVLAEAVGPKNVRVRIPPYELARPAGFISRVLQTQVFMTPQTPARVCINRTTGHVSFTGSVTISPTVLQLPGLGTLAIAGGEQGPNRDRKPGPNRDRKRALDTASLSQGRAGPPADAKRGGVGFQELLNTLSKLQLTPEQMVEAIEHLHRTGTLHAQLVYTE